MADSNLDIVGRYYELMGQDRFDEANEMLAADVVLHETPDVPFGGDYHGIAGVSGLFAKVTQVLDLAIARIDILDAGDPILVCLVARFKSKASGEVVEMQVVELIRVRDGKIAEIDIYYKKPSAVAALWRS